MPIRVLLVDDVPDIRFLLSIACSRHEGLEVVGEAANGYEAVSLAKELQPDVCLLDLAMPEMDGLTAMSEIRKVSPGTRILVLSAFSNDRVRNQAIERCAMGYIEKGTPMADITQAVETVHLAPPEQALCLS